MVHVSRSLLICSIENEPTSRPESFVKVNYDSGLERESEVRSGCSPFVIYFSLLLAATSGSDRAKNSADPG